MNSKVLPIISSKNMESKTVFSYKIPEKVYRIHTFLEIPKG